RRSTSRGEAVYVVYVLPLGGHVRLIVVFPPKDLAHAACRGRTWFSRVADGVRHYCQAEIPEVGGHRAFYALPAPKELAGMFGGPVVNLILAVVLFAVVLTGFGTATATNKLGSVSECVPEGMAECAADDPAAPAVAAGFQPGDRVLEWGGQKVSTWEEVSSAIRAGGEAPTEVVIDRGGAHLSLSVTPTIAARPVVGEDGQVELDAEGEPALADAPYLGIGAAVELVPAPLGEVPGVVTDVFTGTVQVVLSLPARLVAIADAVFTDAERDPSVVGLVGVGRFAGEIAS